MLLYYNNHCCAILITLNCSELFCTTLISDVFIVVLGGYVSIYCAWSLHDIR